MTLKYLLEKEFKMIRRNSFLPRMIIMMPLMMMLVFPHVGTMEVKDIRICIVDYDRSETSRRITERIASSPYFILVGVTVSHSDAIRMIEKVFAQLRAAASAPQRALASLSEIHA